MKDLVILAADKAYGKHENLAVHPYISRLQKGSPCVDVRIQRS